MIVCKRCLMAIEAHEGGQITRTPDKYDFHIHYGDYNDDGSFTETGDMFDPEWFECEWCGDMCCDTDVKEII